MAHEINQPLSTKPGGSGVGLFVVHTAAQIHGGRLELGWSSTLGGAEVLLRLPVLSLDGSSL